MRDEADLRAAGQCARQRDRVLDRTLGKRAVLEGVDTAGEPRRQRPPEIAVAGAQVAEAAQGARRRAMYEHQHWAFSRWHWRVRVIQIDGFEIARLAAGADPAVQPRLLDEPLLDRPHQSLGAGPRHAKVGLVGKGFQCIVNDLVGRRTHRESVDFADQPTQRFAEAAPRRRAISAHFFEQDRTVLADEFRMREQQRRAQPLGACDQRAAIGQFEHDDFIRPAGVRLPDIGAGRSARGRTDVDSGGRD